MPDVKSIKPRPGMYACFFEPLKEIAFNHGYNLIIHGSLNRDFDLVAIPWIDYPSPHLELIQDFDRYLNNVISVATEDKEVPPKYMHSILPGGRSSYVIDLNRGGRWNNYDDKQYYLDISITPADECRSVLSELVSLKNIKDAKGKTENYLKLQPLAWERANEMLNRIPTNGMKQIRNNFLTSVDNLKPHHIEFLKYCCSDLPYRVIADSMCVSPRTIDGYRDYLFMIAGVKTRVGLALYAIHNGIFSVKIKSPQ